MLSVIIAVEPQGDAKACLKAIQGWTWPKSRREVLLVKGMHPSKQRNAAVRQAKGEWLLFLDSDARSTGLLPVELLFGARFMFAAAAGGPNLGPPDEPWWGKVFSAVLGSYFGSMSSAARYRSFGSLRKTNEKELILCNLLVSKKAFMDVGGFREDLYPNEENEFFNRLQAQGHQLAYQPSAVVYRPRRATVGAFAKQAFNYGRGRMQQVKAAFSPNDLVNFLPIFAFAWLGLAISSGGWLWYPVLAYPVLALLAGLKASFSAQGLAVALMFPLRHVGYGLGLLAGIFSSGAARRDAGKIVIQRVKL